MIAAIKIMIGSFTFFTFNNTTIVNNAIIVVGMSFIVLIAITTTVPAKGPTTAAVIPSTKAPHWDVSHTYESKERVTQ